MNKKTQETEVGKQIENIDLELTKKDLDKLSEYLESDNFRRYGYGHLTLDNKNILTISCDELTKNREEYEKSLKRTGLKTKEIIEHFNNLDKISGEEKVESEIEDLQKRLEDAKQIAEERLNQLKYLQADFDNYRKKFDKEKEQIIKLASENLIKELIIILDDFEGAIKSVENEKNKEGIHLLQKKFLNVLEKHGLKKIEALGKKFDPDFHEVLHKEFSEHNEEEIIEEIQRGYLLHSKVIRPAKVKISKGFKKIETREED